MVLLAPRVHPWFALDALRSEEDLFDWSCKALLHCADVAEAVMCGG